jgi:hypothetical protein
VPGAHVEHTEEPATATEPTAQGAHVLRPAAAAKVPAAQGTHEVAFVLPMSALEEPAGHSVQSTDADASANVPAVQGVHRAAPAALKLPATHAVQADAPVAAW